MTDSPGEAARPSPEEIVRRAVTDLFNSGVLGEGQANAVARVAFSVVVSVPAVDVSAIIPQRLIDLRQLGPDGTLTVTTERSTTWNVEAPAVSEPVTRDELYEMLALLQSTIAGLPEAARTPQTLAYLTFLVSLMTYVLALLGYKA